MPGPRYGIGEIEMKKIRYKSFIPELILCTLFIVIPFSYVSIGVVIYGMKHCEPGAILFGVVFSLIGLGTYLRYVLDRGEGWD